ncbi:hypothetical protein H311_00313 [Anncaliia algerae PRA109]|nr:hypothetical protein H311_00313 [Anncaliia algerae PRA109]
METFPILITLLMLKSYFCTIIGGLPQPPEGYHYVFEGNIIITSSPEDFMTGNLSNGLFGRVRHAGITNFDLNTEKEDSIEFTASIKPIARDDYLEKMIAFLTKQYWIDPKTKPNVDDVKQTLLTIYDEISDAKELLIITAISVFETNAFMKMHEEPIPEGDKWYSRGILQIYLEERYIHIAKLTKNIEFLDNPDILSNLDLDATTASLLFWKYLVSEAQTSDPSYRVTWANALILLSPRDLQPDQKDYIIKKKAAGRLFQTIVMLFAKQNECSMKDRFDFITSTIAAAESVPLEHRKKKHHDPNNCKIN